MPTQSDSTITVGVDVGGTNTDLLMTHGEEEYTHKTPTTNDPSKSTAKVISEACDRVGVESSAISRVIHGTTIATNSVIEDEGADTGMLVTDGFRDVTHIGRHRKPHNFSIQQELPWQENPVVERRHRKRIPERIYPPDNVDEPLDEQRVLTATEELLADGIESISVCFLHSYLDPSHENRAKELIEAEYPEVFVCTSNEVIGQFREFERFTTTAINASLQPDVSSYLDRLSERLDGLGIDAEILVMQSNGGLASVAEVSQFPVQMVTSGPAAGVLSAEFQGIDSLSVPGPKLITFDMGGTSADISVVPGEVLERDPRDSRIGGFPVITPMIDIEAIGSGGGSIAWFDHAHGFNIGPRSAGADPGPACYDRGNDEPTVTDAQVVLGRINPDVFLGGEFSIDPALSRRAIEEYLCGAVDDPRFSDPISAALSTLEIANTKMYQAIREQTVRRGYDPREYTLVAFGGAGPMHATALASSLDITSILIPVTPGITSARGLLTGDIKYDQMRTVSRRLNDVDAALLDEEFDALTDETTDRLRRDGVSEDALDFELSLDCLYEGQGYELNVPFDGTDGDWRSRIRERFTRKHEDEYGHYFEDDPITVLNVRVTSYGRIADYDLPTLSAESVPLSTAELETTQVVFGSPEEPVERDVPRYRREKLVPGHEIAGPAIVDEADSTVVVDPGWTARVLPNRTILLSRGEDNE